MTGHCQKPLWIPAGLPQQHESLMPINVSILCTIFDVAELLFPSQTPTPSSAVTAPLPAEFRSANSALCIKGVSSGTVSMVVFTSCLFSAILTT